MSDDEFTNSFGDESSTETDSLDSLFNEEKPSEETPDKADDAPDKSVDDEEDDLEDNEVDEIEEDDDEVDDVQDDYPLDDDEVDDDDETKDETETEDDEKELTLDNLYKDDDDDEDDKPNSKSDYDKVLEDKFKEIQANADAQIAELKKQIEDAQAKTSESAPKDFSAKSFLEGIDKSGNWDFGKDVGEYFEDNEDSLNAIAAVANKLAIQATEEATKPLVEKIEELKSEIDGYKSGTEENKEKLSRIESFNVLASLGHPDAERIIGTKRFQKWLDGAPRKISKLAEGSLDDFAKVFDIYKKRFVGNKTSDSNKSNEKPGRQRKLNTSSKSGAKKTVVRRSESAEPTEDELDKYFREA